MKKVFTVLMFCGIFVDEKNLGRGVYGTELPTLHSEGETMESLMQKKIDAMRNSGVRHESHDTYMRNLATCELVKMEVLVPEYIAPVVSPPVVEEVAQPVENNPEGDVPVEDLPTAPSPAEGGEAVLMNSINLREEAEGAVESNDTTEG